MTTADLLRDVAALAAPGGAHGTTVPQRASAAPKGWEPGIVYKDGGGMLVTSTPTQRILHNDEAAWQPFVEESMGIELPPGYVAILKEAKFDPAAWTRDTEFIQYPDGVGGEATEDDPKSRDGSGPARKSPWTKAPAVTRPVWRYKFSIELASERMHADDVDRILAEILRRKRKRPAPADADTPRALNVVFADPQAGKVAILGGTEALAARFADCFDMLSDHIRDMKKLGRGFTEATWWDGGDCIEGFSNTRQQERTNDLQLTQQVRAHRRLTYHGLDFLSARFPKVAAYTCGSNHGRVRDGKDPVGPSSDDWGIEVLAQVQDGYAHNPDTYGHVRFGYPHEHRDTLLAVSGGLPIGLAHGHQFKSGDTKAVRDWWQGQTFGNQPVADARVLITGHFHHFAAREMGDGRLWVQAPTLDNGSDWFTQVAGEVSVPGLLVFSSTPAGIDDLRILRGTGAAWGREAA